MKTKYLTVLCDFDGTITVDDVTDTLLTALTGTKWIEYGEEYVKGKSSHAQMNKHFASLLKASDNDVNKILSTITIREGFIKFVKRCINRDIRFIVISSGWDYYITRLLPFPSFKVENINTLSREISNQIPVISNVITYNKGDNSWDLDLPWDSTACPLSSPCKGQLLEILKARFGGKFMVIGNSESDICMAEKADVVYSIGTLSKICKNKKIFSTDFSDFNSILV